MNRLARRSAAAATGLVVDRLLGEPPTALHPVAWFGTAMGRVEQRLWADKKLRGVAYAITGVALGAVSGVIVRSTTVAVAVAVAGNALRTTAEQVGQTTQAGDIDQARADLRALVGRDPSALDASGIAAAVIESVAENSVDAVVSPVFWALMAGAPGALGYRAVNTMDAMVGHRSDRYRHFGTAAARIDDVANWIPARLFALMVAGVRPGQARYVREIVRRDASSHPSPNAGVAESAMAAVLGRQLGGPLSYHDRVEQRPSLGDGPRPSPTDITKAISVAHHAERLLAAFLWAVACTGVMRAHWRPSR